MGATYGISPRQAEHLGVKCTDAAAADTGGFSVAETFWDILRHLSGRYGLQLGAGSWNRR